MALRNQKPINFQPVRHLSGLWVSYKKGKKKNSKGKKTEAAIHHQLYTFNCQLNLANETLQDVYFDDISGLVRRPKIIQEVEDQAGGMTLYYPFGLLSLPITIMQLLSWKN